MSRCILCAVFIALSGILYAFTFSTAALLLLGASVILPAAALLTARLSAGAVSVSLQLPADIRKKEPAQCILAIKNRSFLPVSRAELELTVENAFIGSRQSFRFSYPVGSYESREETFLFEADCCGRISFTCSGMRICDFLGLWGFRRNVEIEEQRLVFPEAFSTRVTLTGGEEPGEGSEILSLFRKGHNMSEPLQIREYAEGDRMKQIHWKLTQRMGRYMVTEPSLELHRALLMLWAGEEIPSGVSPRVPDTLAEAFTSVCLSLAEEEIAFDAAWKSGETDDIAVQYIGSAEDVFDAVANILCGGTTISRSEEPVQEYGAQEHERYPLVAYFSCRTRKDLLPLADAERTAAFICTADGEEAEEEEDAEHMRWLFSPENCESVLRGITI